MGKRLAELEKTIDRTKSYNLKQACELVKKSATAKFDETVELHIRLGIDVKKTDQSVRGATLLPHGTGKTRSVAVVAKGEKIREAQAAGADFAGEADLIEKIAKGWLGFDVLVATPDAMKDLTKLGKILGPKGLMPNPKTGTVTFEVGRIVKELKAGRVEFKSDATGIIHCPIGKASFPPDQLEANAKTLIEAVQGAKPQAVKGAYIASVTLCSTMGPGVKVNPDIQTDAA
jgi:large subunit ribosomal protein L1